MVSKRLIRTAFVAAALAAIVAGCGDDDAPGTPDASDIDAAGNIDAADDIDAAGDIDAGPDADTTVPDAAVPDADLTPDAPPPPDADLTPDAPPPSTTIAELRAAANGPVGPFLLENVYVTYVRFIGYYIQAEPTGPAIFVYTNADPGLAVGNQVDLVVTAVDEFHGSKQITGSAIVSNDNGSYDVVTNFAQDISAAAGTAPSEDLEGELVRVTGMHVVSGGAPNFTATIGTAPVTINYYSYEGAQLALCAGAVLDTVGIVDQSDSNYLLRSYYAADASNVVTTGCNVPSTDNWDFEDWATSDPAPGFVKATTAFTMTQSTTEFHVGTGVASANLTWTSTANQDLRAEFHAPVTAGTDYSCHGWFKDNDPAGKARIFITWYDADSAPTNSFPSGSGGYTADSADWQERVWTATAPNTAVTMTCGARLYDDVAPFTSATVYLDDLSITP